MSLISTIKNFGGTSKLYTGANLCLMRDIPFSAIYFPVYSHLKNRISSVSKYSTLNYFIAGTLAGFPAAYLVTPMDVVKTRIQTSPKLYGSDILSCVRAIYQNEGIFAFWKGGFGAC